MGYGQLATRARVRASLSTCAAALPTRSLDVDTESGYNCTSHMQRWLIRKDNPPMRPCRGGVKRRASRGLRGLLCCCGSLCCCRFFSGSIRHRLRTRTALGLLIVISHRRGEDCVRCADGVAIPLRGHRTAAKLFGRQGYIFQRRLSYVSRGKALAPIKRTMLCIPRTSATHVSIIVG